MKTIHITGSSRGIGAATARLAATKGYRVIVHGRSDSNELKKIHNEIDGSVKTFFDISDKKGTLDAIGKLGRIDILINNAGMGYTGLKNIADLDESKALEEYRVNILGTLHCIQAVVPSLVKQGSGSVVNVASLKGHFNLTTLSSLSYGVVKAGVIALTQALAKAYPTVRFNSVSPGYVQTDMSDTWPDETFERIKKGTIIGRIARPEEIAGTILFLASDEASYITGIDLLVDGGYSLKGK